MKNHNRKLVGEKRFNHKGLFSFAVISLLWFIFRTGTKPSRIVYPCQRAALANSSILLNAFVSLSLFTTSVNSFLSKKSRALVVLAILGLASISSQPFWQGLQTSAAINPNQEVQLTLESKGATTFPASNIYAVNGRTYAHINELVSLAASHGLHFYKTALNPQGILARDDVVLIKTNCQWSQRGGTNTDVLKELIQAIVDHPEGFIGEIVVADNGQVKGGMDFGDNNNAENHSQSVQDVVNMFTPTYHVSTREWMSITSNRVNEYSQGDTNDGYIVYNTADPETGLYVTYPKFRTSYGTYISFKNGIWNGAAYEKRLKVINLPTLKGHGNYGVTASLKNYMGVQSEGKNGASPFTGLGNGHGTVGSGSMGTLMAEVGLPALNIVDAIWINANPSPEAASDLIGPSTDYTEATRTNVLIASTDPVALDYWAAKYALKQAAQLIGYTDPYMFDPENTDETGLVPGDSTAFGQWLPLARNELVQAGYSVTNSESRMNVYVYPNGEGPGDITPPAITILSPQSVTYSAHNIPLTFKVSEPTSWIGYSLNGQTNLTVEGNTTISGLSDGTHTIIVYANDTSGNTGKSNTVLFTTDTIAPHIQILSPQNRTYTTSSVSLNFKVDESTSWIGYSLNGQGNITIGGNTTLINLSEQTHTITIYANDTGGNTGRGDPVYFTIDMPFHIAIFSPQNKTYAVNSVDLSFSIDKEVSWISYSLDGEENITIAGNTTLTGLLDGGRTIVVYARDADGNTSSSYTIFFTIDTTPPVISILSPENKTYNATDIPLTFVLNEPVSWIAYSLNNQANITITGNITLSGLSYELYKLTLYATDTAGNTGTSETINFSVEAQQQGFPVWVMAAIGIIAAVGVGIILVFLTKRKARRKWQAVAAGSL